MSIFATPQRNEPSNDYGVKILFLHGLEGSASGAKAVSLQEKWGAMCPTIRTANLRELKEKCADNWDNATQGQIDQAIKESLSDVTDAVRYMQPDIIVGSSLGGALLLKLYASGQYSGPGVFLAPAIPNLISDTEVAKAHSQLQENTTSWVLGELDTIVPNRPNIRLARLVGGNIIVTPNDTHRLEISRESGIIDAAILTCIELDVVDD